MKRITKITRSNIVGNGLVEIEQFKFTSKTYLLNNVCKCISFKQFFDCSAIIIILKLDKMTQNAHIKFNIYIDRVYKNCLTQVTRDIAFKTSNVFATNNSNFALLLNKMYNTFLIEETEFLTKGSG